MYKLTITKPGTLVVQKRVFRIWNDVHTTIGHQVIFLVPWFVMHIHFQANIVFLFHLIVLISIQAQHILFQNVSKCCQKVVYYLAYCNFLQNAKIRQEWTVAFTSTFDSWCKTKATQPFTIQRFRQRVNFATSVCAVRFELRRGACVLYAAASHGLLAQPLALAFANRLAVWLNSSFLRHRSVSAATIQHHFRMLLPGLGTFSGTKATQYKHYFPHKITEYFSKMCSF